MKLTKQQLRAAARHARELAMECVNGTAPKFGWWFVPENGKPCCPVGGLSLLSYAEIPDSERILRLPFALLYLADELENAASAAPQDLP